jgi:hypothetical protein
MYIDFKFDLLFLAFVIGIFISLITKLERPLIISVIIVVIYILLVFINNETRKPKTRLLSSEEATILLNNNEKKQTKEVKENYNQGSAYKKSNGLFDGLHPTQLINRFNYLYDATKHPQRAKSYVNYMFNSNNKTVPNSVKHLEETARYYPQLSRDQVNMMDCMIYDSNHPASCNQGNDKWMAENKIITSGINNKRDLNQVIREDFKPPNLLLEASSQSLFK